MIILQSLSSESLGCPWWRKTGSEPCCHPVIHQHYITCSDLFVFIALILSGFLKALVFAISIFQEPLLVLGCHLPGMISSGLSLCVSLIGCPFFFFFFYWRNNATLLIFYPSLSESSWLRRLPGRASGNEIVSVFSGSHPEPSTAQTTRLHCSSRGLRTKEHALNKTLV